MEDGEIRTAATARARCSVSLHPRHLPGRPLKDGSDTAAAGSLADIAAPGVVYVDYVWGWARGYTPGEDKSQEPFERGQISLPYLMYNSVFQNLFGNKFPPN
jgi:hypothetical protein